MNKCIVDYTTSSMINKIEHSDIIKVNSFKNTIYFYNPTVCEPLVKFMYLIKNAKIVKQLNNKIYIVFTSIDTQLIESIKNLDTKTSNILKQYCDTHVNNTITEKKTFPPEMEIYLENSILYNKDGKTTYNISVNSTIMLLIELDSIIIETGYNKAYRKWRAVQIKENESIISKLNINFIDCEPINEVVNKNKPPPPPHIQLNIQPPQIKPDVNKPVILQNNSFPITNDELLNQLKKLKKHNPIKHTNNEYAINEQTINEQLIKQRDKLKKKINGDVIEQLLQKQSKIYDEFNKTIAHDKQIIDKFNC